MGVIPIENVDKQTLRSIRLRAEVNRRSFEDEVRALLAGADEIELSPAERAAEANRIRAMTKGCRRKWIASRSYAKCGTAGADACQLVTADRHLITKMAGTRSAPLMIALDSVTGSP